MYKIKNHSPNCLSILNLISGVIGIVFVVNDCSTVAAYAVFIGASFDFLDGFIAKLLHVQSSMGKQLDSLADLVTFGILPAAILYKLMYTYSNIYVAYTALGMIVCTAIRLAKFNVDQRQANRFIGLPTPANAILVATLPLILERATYPYWVYGLTRPWVLPLLTILLSYLLISDVPCMALKFKTFSFQVNRFRYGLLGIGLLLVGMMQIEGLFITVWFYIFCSLCQNQYEKKNFNR